MSDSCFAARLGDLAALAPNEQRALTRLEQGERALRRGETLQRERDPAGHLFVLRRGMMLSSVLLDDGSRQILRVHFAGDLLAVSNLVYRKAAETITALSDCVVCPFDRPTLSAILSEHPRLAALVMVYTQIERAALTDRLAALGRTSAKARVAAILMEMRSRMLMLEQEAAPAEDGSFALGLTQEEIGDATGLTAVHVNRMLRQLEEEGMITREGGRVIFRDERRLARAANFVDRHAGLDLGWLPAAR